jgi:hypothetical protein
MIAIATQESLQALRELEKQYKEDSSKVQPQHISVCIKEIAGRVDWEHRNVLAIRYLVHSITESVLDLMEDTAKLNDHDDDILAPLRIAIKEGMLDCVAVLLARGAHVDNLPAYLHADIKAIFDLHKLLVYQEGSDDRRQGMKMISTSCWRKKAPGGPSMYSFTIRDLALNSQLAFLLWANEPLRSGEILRLHLPLISVGSHCRHLLTDVH